MIIDNKNIVKLDLKKEEKILDFSDFQKQNIKFDIDKLQEAYSQIIQTKKFDDGGGIAHFGAISLTQIPGDPDSYFNYLGTFINLPLTTCLSNNATKTHKI